MQRLSARRLIFLPIFLAALVLAVAACGSDDEGGTAAPADTASDTTGATETTKEPAELSVALDWFATPTTSASSTPRTTSASTTRPSPSR